MTELTNSQKRRKEYMNAPHPLLSDAERQKWYLEHKGIRCPKCGENDVTCGSPETTCDPMIIEMSCRCSCGFKWTDEFTLTGFRLDQTE